MENKVITRIRKRNVPVWERALLTLNEASEYTGIGINRLRRIAINSQNNLVIFIGTKRMFKRKRLDEYLDRTASV